MNFSAMEYFVVLAQERNFTKAAERLYITQQSLSSSIANMEKELGTQLIIRHVPLELTYAGEILLEYATKFSKGYVDLERQFCDISQNHRGRLRIGIAPARARAILPGIVRIFQKQYPNITVAVTESSNISLTQKVAEGDLDLAIADFSKKVPNIALQDFYIEEIILVASRQLLEQVYRGDAGDVQQKFSQGDFRRLGSCPLVFGTYEDIHGTIGTTVLKRNQVEHPLVRIEAHNANLMLEMCLQGIGACFCPSIIVEKTLTEQDRKQLLMFHLGTGSKYSIRFGYKQGSYQWGIIKEFIRCAKKYME